MNYYPCSRISCKGSYSRYSFVVIHMASFTQQNAIVIHPHCCYISNLFLFWIHHDLFPCIALHELLSCYQLLAFINKAAVNIHIQAFLWTCLFIYLGVMPKSRIARPYNKNIFSLRRNYETVSRPLCLLLYLLSTLSLVILWLKLVYKQSLL